MHSIKWADGDFLFIIHGDVLEKKMTNIIDSSLAEVIEDMEERKNPRGSLLQNAKPACDVSSALISTQELWKESNDPLRWVQDGTPIWEVNIHFFANIIFCGSENSKPSATFEFATFLVLFYFFMKEHLWTCVCQCVFEDLAQHGLSLKNELLQTQGSWRQVMKTEMSGMNRNCCTEPQISKICIRLLFFFFKP